MQHAAKDDVITPLSSRQRLADISHHFLSEEGEQPDPWQKTRLIPLLLVCREDDYVAYLIKDALQRDEQTCSVLNIESQSAPLAIPTASKQQAAPDICLLPLTSPGAILAIPHSKLLMAVPASLPGIRLAYHQLAQLAEQKSHITVNVIMLDARNEKQGERYFSFLCDSARSLLSLDIKSVGILHPQQDTHGYAADIINSLLANEEEGSSPTLLSGAEKQHPLAALANLG